MKKKIKTDKVKNINEYKKEKKNKYKKRKNRKVKKVILRFGLIIVCFLIIIINICDTQLWVILNMIYIT